MLIILSSALMLGIGPSRSSGERSDALLGRALVFSPSLDDAQQEVLHELPWNVLPERDHPAPNASSVQAKERTKALEERISGLTPERLHERIWNVSVLGRISQQNQFFFRATGLLQLRPELSTSLIPLFDDDAMTYEGRTFIVDLLVGAGHGEAQRVLQTLLESESLKRKKFYPILFQRISWVTNPEPALVAFTAAEYADLKTVPYVTVDEPGDTEMSDEAAPQESKAFRKLASIYALGSVVGNLYRTERQGLALEYNGWLLHDLRRATTLREKEAYLAAIGNAGLQGNGTTVLAYVSHPESALRRTAADALRQTNTKSARTALLKLLTDRDLQVQQRALASLTPVSLGGQEMQAVAQMVARGKTNAGLDASLVAFFARQAPAPELAQPALVAMLNRHTGDGQLEARINTLYGELQRRVHP